MKQTINKCYKNKSISYIINDICKKYKLEKDFTKGIKINETNNN